MSDPTRPLAVGDVIHGFAEGAFGSSSYNCKKIEAVGPDWIVCRDEDGAVHLTTGTEDLELCKRNRESQWDGCCKFDTKPPLTTWGWS